MNEYDEILKRREKVLEQIEALAFDNLITASDIVAYLREKAAVRSVGYLKPKMRDPEKRIPKRERPKVYRLYLKG